MGNDVSTPAAASSSGRHRRSSSSPPETATSAARRAAASVYKKLDNGDLLDNLCGPYFDDSKLARSRSYTSAYSEYSDEETATQYSDQDTLDSSAYHSRRKDGHSESGSMLSQSDYESSTQPTRRSSKSTSKRGISEDTESMDSQDSSWHKKKINNLDDGVVTETTSSELGPGPLSKQPLASSFAKRCYFTKAGIGKTTQHYEGLTLTGNIVLMLASAMKLKGCPTICDEDLRRVEQTYPNQFSRLPDELLLSSGWRRISKYCHFSNKPIPDGIPFFHSRQRMHPSGGYYFLLAAAVGMIRPLDVEPLTRDTLVLLETDYPTQCDQLPPELVEDASLWTLVDKFCFFSGGPINAEEDVYYQADFDGNPIYMLAFLSPSLTPEELYKLSSEESGLKSVVAVEDVESVYDLTERDFDDLKLYHLGPCRALPSYILQPDAWTKVLPPHFLIAKEEALIRAHEYEVAHGTAPPEQPPTQPPPPLDHYPPGAPPPPPNEYMSSPQEAYHEPPPYGPALDSSYQEQPEEYRGATPPPESQQFAPVHHASSGSFPYFSEKPNSSFAHDSATQDSITHEQNNFQREVEEEGAFVSNTIHDAPIDEALATRARLPPMMSSKGSNVGVSPPGYKNQSEKGSKLDPPEDEPPSLSRFENAPEDENLDEHESRSYYTEEEPSYDERGQDYEQEQNGGYYRESEYYGSPEKENDGYYPREEEYYVSPENIPPNQREGDYYDHDVPDKSNHSTSDYVSREDDYYEPPMENSERGEYYADGGGSAPEKKSEQEGDDYYDSPRASFSPREDEYDASYSTEPEESGGDPTYPEEGSPSFRDDPDDPSYHEEESPRQLKAEKESNVTDNTSGFTDPPTTTNAASSSANSNNGSSALRGAHELLKRTRQKRFESAKKQNVVRDAETPTASPPRKNVVRDMETPTASPPRKQHGDNGNSWESSSEMTSVVSGSSVWTDNSTTDRSSRRALILQMAKARMKSNKSKVEEAAPQTIAEEDVLAKEADISFHGELD